jgi:hypothetical protein
MEFQASSSAGCNTNDIKQIISVSQFIGLSMHSCKLQSVEDFQHGSTATNSINSVLFVSCGRGL